MGGRDVVEPIEGEFNTLFRAKLIVIEYGQQWVKVFHQTLVLLCLGADCFSHD
jgi:hypothetical protein